MARRSALGFTLIECFVSLIALLILGAMVLALMRVVGPYRTSSLPGPTGYAAPSAPSGIKCRGHLQTILRACAAYALDNGNFWPAQCDNFGTPDSSDIHLHAVRSMALLYPGYLDRSGVFWCPSTADEPRIDVSWVGGKRRTSFGGYDREKGVLQCASYGYDQFLSPRSAGSKTIVIGDMAGPAAETPFFREDHTGGRNLGYFDGHVGWSSSMYASDDKRDNIYARDGGEVGGIGIAKENWWGADTDTMLNRISLALMPNGRTDVSRLVEDATDCPRARKGEWSADPASRP